MHDDDFEWDDDKAAANLREHGVAFELAREVFADRLHWNGSIQPKIMEKTATPLSEWRTHVCFSSLTR